MGYELSHESFVVLEGNYTFVVVAGRWLFELHPLPDEPLDPESDRARKDGERGDGDLATALSTAPRVRPREKGENAARTSCLVAEVEVVGSGIVEVDRSLYQSKAESSRIEIKIALGIAGDAGDVMDTGSAETHCGSF
jgi:hypothetical protein